MSSSTSELPSRKHSRVLPVRVHEEAGEGAVCLGAGVKAVVLGQRHLHPHLVAGDQVEERAARQGHRLGPVAVELEVGRHGVRVFHQVELQAGSVDRGVDGEEVHSGDFAGEAARLRAVVVLLVQQDFVELDRVAHAEGQRAALGDLGAERRLGGDGALSGLTPLAFLSRVPSVPHQAPQSRLT